MLTNLPENQNLMCPLSLYCRGTGLASVMRAYREHITAPQRPAGRVKSLKRERIKFII
jgi:hypothetical protein